MTYIEYPKMLYRGEENTIVQGVEDEDARRAEGWGPPGVTEDPAPGATEDDALDLIDAPAKRKIQRRPAVVEPQDGV